MDCSVENCTKPIYSKKLGICSAHYQKYLRYGTPTPSPEMKAKPGPKPDPSKPRSRHNPDNPARSRPKKPKVERTHCKNGHELTDETLRTNTKGHHYCATCSAEASQRSRKNADPAYGTRRDKYSPEALAVSDAVCKNGHTVTSETVLTDPKGRRRCPECYSASVGGQRLRKYGITQEQYDALLAHQGGVCAVCTQPMSGSRTEVIDHDHATGQVRGIIHGGCNVALGMLDDNPEWFLNAAKYLMDSWRLSTDSPSPADKTGSNP